MKKMFLLLFVFTVGILQSGITQKTITFNSLDGLEITADLYALDNVDAPIILLCHQAGWSRGEYLEIAPKLNEMGYTCLALDQRSGRAINGTENETHNKAKDANLGTNYLDAEQDINAGLKYIIENFKDASKVILWGSSYSSALALKVASENETVSAVLSFSPGEYFKKLGETDHYITDAVKNLDKPVFITSAKDEHDSWEGIFKAIPSENKIGFLPNGKGKHGSRALWEQFPDHKEYWEAVTAFLKTI